MSAGRSYEIVSLRPAWMFIVLCLALLCSTGCGGGGSPGPTNVQMNVTVPQKTASASSSGARLLANVFAWLPGPSEASAVSATDIARIRIEISAPDFAQPQVETVAVNLATGTATATITVEGGSSRTFTIYGLHTDGSSIYFGRQTDVTLNGGTTATVEVTLSEVPRVAAISPADGATNVTASEAGARATISFSKTVDSSTVNTSTISMSANGSSISGTVVCNSPCSTAAFVPAATTIVPGATYTVTVTTGVKDAEGVSLVSAFTASFTTAATPSNAGTIAGTVTDSGTGLGISGATVGISALSISVPTSNTGKFLMNNVTAGTYTVAATASGYVAHSVASVAVTAGVSTQIGISLSTAGATNGEFKIILNWGANPRDLDAHLRVPSAGTSVGNFTEVYYASRGSLTVSPFAQLDQDVTAGFGPETIRIAAPPNRRTQSYCYYVQKFAGTGNITSSGASVQVLNGDAVIENFTVPTSGTGDYWRVFTLNGATGAITTVNTINTNISSFCPDPS